MSEGSFFFASNFFPFDGIVYYTVKFREIISCYAGVYFYVIFMSCWLVVKFYFLSNISNNMETMYKNAKNTAKFNKFFIILKFPPTF